MLNRNFLFFHSEKLSCSDLYMPPLMITFFILHSLDRPRRRPIWTGCWLIFSGMRHFILSWHVTIYLPPSLLLEAKRKPQYEMPHSFICIYDFSYLFSRSQFWWLKLREREVQIVQSALITCLPMVLDLTTGGIRL